METRKPIAFYSPEGQNILNDTAIRQTLLIRVFSKQQVMGHCGIQSAALVMSARYFGKKYPEKTQQATCDVSDVPYVDHNMFTFEQTRAVLDHERLLTSGATLKEIQDLLQSHGLSTKRVHADNVSVDEFRSLAKTALLRADSSQGVIVNYEYVLQKDGVVSTYGHFSPLAAYHEDTDRFLLMDVWIDGQVGWIKTVQIFQKMKTTDVDAGLRRGFLIIG